MVQRFKGSKVQRFKGSKVQGFKGSKVQGFKGSKVQGFGFAAALAAIALATTLGAQEKKPDEAKNVAGTWNIELMSHQVALVLEQDGTKVTGTLMMMSNDMPLKGDFVDGKLTLVGVNREAADHVNREHGGGNAKGEGGAEPKPITATLMEDGTLQGEMQTNRGPVKWTGERLKKRK